MIEIRRITWDEFENDPAYPYLVSENTEESHIDGMPEINVQGDIYRVLEKNGSYFILGAFLGEELVGVINIIVTVLPHYGVRTAMTESFFVRKKYRKTGAGIKLRLSAEEFARSIGSPGFFISSPMGGILSKILPKSGYRETNQIFFKSFLNE